MGKETMIALVYPNGNVVATRKSMAERIVKKKQARYQKDVLAENVAAEKAAAEADAKAKAASKKSDKDED